MITLNNKRVAAYTEESNINQSCYYRSILNYFFGYHLSKGIDLLEKKESPYEETSDECIESSVDDKKNNFFLFDRDSSKSQYLFSENESICSTSSLKSFEEKENYFLYPEIFKPKRNNNMDESASLKWFDMPEHVKIEIFSYLSPSELRAMSKINYESYTLACSRQVWKQHLNKIWSYLFNYENEGYHIQFDYDYLTKNEFCKKSSNINFKILYALSTSYPSQMDINIFSLHTQNICFKKYKMISATNCCTTTKRSLEVYQLYSSTWLDDVNISSDLPFPIQNQVISSLSSSKTLLSCLFSCFPQKSVQPFIAPFATKVDEKTKKLEMNLSPRFVAYYEVTLLQRDIAQEPKCPNTIARYSSALERITIGLSLRTAIKIYESYGYHGDNGGFFHSNEGIFHNQGQMLLNKGPTFTYGDTVGCGIDYIENAIFFTHNGKFLGYAWKDVNLNKEWFPTVGIDTESPFEINFGNVPFVFDLNFFLEKHFVLVSSNKLISSIYNLSP